MGRHINVCGGTTYKTYYMYRYVDMKMVVYFKIAYRADALEAGMFLVGVGSEGLLGRALRQQFWGTWSFNKSTMMPIPTHNTLDPHPHIHIVSLSNPK